MNILQKLKSFFGGGVSLGELRKIVDEINALEPEIKKLSDEELKAESLKLRRQPLDGVLPRAFALAREGALRTLRQRHFDVQLVGGIALHKGAIAEMLTGEGKTLAATAPAYLNALSGEGVHIVTVNDYLAMRDAVWMGQIYYALGISTACIAHDAAYIYDPEWRVEESKLADQERDTTGSFLIQHDYLRPVSRREAYLADITYGTNHEFGFDYLRDNLAYGLEQRVQRGHNYAIIDEVDSILIDEARTPLIISAPDTASSEYYRVFARVASSLQPDEDYTVDEKLKVTNITDSGIDKVEKLLNIKNIYDPESIRLVHYLQESLRARALYHYDKEYVVKDGKVIIVDEFTGRMLPGRRYSGGLHQAIEAKEGVTVEAESRTYAQITIQNYFRLYKKLAGMTGTAQTSAEEFHKVYGLEVMSIPPNRPMVREDLPDVIYKTFDAKIAALVREIAERREKGQPVLVGTVSIEKNEIVSDALRRAGIPHEVLNAKNHEREGTIIAQAGKSGGVTIATNMAGRGVDIILGGNPPDLLEAEKVKAAGGLHVIGTERHEARRIDNQLRGRAGRQGDPGSSGFFLSLEDDLMRIFGGDRLKNLMESLNVPEDMPIQSKIVSGAIVQAQSKVEGLNFDARKHLLDFDDVLNKQRTSIYRKRQAILEAMSPEDLRTLIAESFDSHRSRMIDQLTLSQVEEWPFDALKQTLSQARILDDATQFDSHVKEWKQRETEIAREDLNEYLKNLIGEKLSRLLEAKELSVSVRLLSTLDLLWMNHLEDMESLREYVRIRAYGQRDPLVEYRGEGHRLFKELLAMFDEWIFLNVFHFIGTKSETGIARPTSQMNIPTSVNVVPKGTGRNDPCPCGSGKKYKKCHGA
ncbi:MAG: preprotein translocase subunit SecA [Parcubacteria group bacterium]|nr:preprotein translocase subunit SecA [Parcubacteria group bacterium]